MRGDANYLLSYDRKFSEWDKYKRGDNAKSALFCLQKHVSVFQLADKENTQRRVLYHLKYTAKVTHLVKNQDHEEINLLRKTLKWFLEEAQAKVKFSRRLQFGMQFFFGVEIQRILAALRHKNITFEDLNQKAKSILFLLGMMPSFQSLHK